MPHFTAHTCNTPDCRNAAPHGQPFCESCTAKQGTPAQPGRYQRPAGPDKHSEYRWRKKGDGVSDLVLSKNPQCQYLDPLTGVQCHRPPSVVHHLIDQKDAPQRFYDWEILVAVCANHHSGGQRGDTQQYAYVDTIGAMDAIYPHGHGLPEWHNDFKGRRVLSESEKMLYMATGRFSL